MDSLSATEKMFGALADVQNQRQLNATYALNKALSLLQDQKYSEAIPHLKRTLAFQPDSTDAYTYMGMAYSKLGKYREQIDAYKGLVRLKPDSPAAYNKLGNAYMEARDYTNAEKQFKVSAKLDPTSTYAPYTLGHLYLNTDRLDEAETQFKKVISIDRKDAHGYYGLGLVYSQLGRNEDAAEQFKMAVSLDKSFALAHSELGNTYAALGEKDKAQQEADLLQSLDTTLAERLSTTLISPQMVTKIYEGSSFNSAAGPATKLSDLDPALATANASQDFTMVFQFNTDMDPLSVQNITNWNINKASGGTAGLYNNGISLNPDAEVSVPLMPKSVTYNPDNYQATVTFTLSQNATADGIIDPSHLVFKFSGKDINGRKMDPSADEFDSFASRVF